MIFLGVGCIYLRCDLIYDEIKLWFKKYILNINWGIRILALWARKGLYNKEEIPPFYAVKGIWEFPFPLRYVRGVVWGRGGVGFDNFIKKRLNFNIEGPHRPAPGAS